MFSVDTFSTIGYGNVVPVGRATNLIVSIKAVDALLNAALVTGLLFARCSRPNVRIQFSERGVVRFSGKPAVLIRLRNLTRNEILEVEATLIAWIHDPTIIETSFSPVSDRAQQDHVLASELDGGSLHHPREPLLRHECRRLPQNLPRDCPADSRNSADGLTGHLCPRFLLTGGHGVGARFADQYIRDETTGVLGIDSERFHATESE